MDQQSQARQEAAGAALAAKRGKADASKLDGVARTLYERMSESELEQEAAATHGVLPESEADTNSGDLARG
ncbi:DUF3008 family protein [Aurantiacibacter suaedae]|uniref:DUF3008 family protein n=1 Tax=Aurantiacibacter suaedae TaxID=2545755 RepID=UPI0010FA30B4|nr:DUF3008 family protein [Aurantiacibacter suaedae]